MALIASTVSAQAFLTNQYLALVMEHMPGGNLLDYITCNSPDVPGVGLHEEIARWACHDVLITHS